MANYPSFGYQPQQMGYQPMQAQTMYQQYQPMQAQPMQQGPAFQCRYVSSEEEARSSQVDFNGTPLFFYDPFRQVAYYKAFNAQAGAIDFFTFRKWQDPQQQEAAQSAVAFAPMSELEGLRAMVVELQSELKAMKNGKQKNVQEVALSDE